jgi:hypothetical protein
MDWQLLAALAIVLVCLGLCCRRLLTGKSTGCGNCSGGKCSTPEASGRELVTLEVPARK